MNIIVKMHDRVRVIETTRMDLHSGIMLEDDFLDISDYLNQGVLLERSVFITTSDDMQLLKRAVTIIEPDELEAVEGVYADGKPILVRTEDGSRLAASVFEVLFDDSGNFMGDHGQGLCIYYESGSYETIVPTVLSFGDGMLMAEKVGAVLTNMDFLCEDTFELLPRLEKEGHPYDFIILDPPAFTKARRTVENAMRGYKEINYRAMKLLPRGGYLATASCSHFATEELFIKMLRSAAKDAHRQLRQIEVRQQAPDHPILWGVPETNYLKFFLFQVI